MPPGPQLPAAALILSTQRSGSRGFLADDELAKVLYSQSQSIRQGAAEKRDANALDAIGRRHLAEHHFAHALHGLGVGERLVCFEVIGV